LSDHVIGVIRAWLGIEYRKYDSGVLWRLFHEIIGHSWVGKKL